MIPAIVGGSHGAAYDHGVHPQLAPPHDRRNFVHKRLIKAAIGLIPGGGTALQVAGAVRSFGGGGPAGGPRAETVDQTIMRMFATHSWADIGRAVGMTAAAAKNRYNRKYRPSHLPAPSRTPSIPPVNPVRAAVVQAKPVSKPGAIAMPRHFRPRPVVSLAPIAGFCPPLMRTSPITGECEFFLGGVPGIDDPSRRMEVGEAVMGRYGAGYVPGSKLIDRAVCLKGDVVGDDGVCYPKRSISNKDRQWPQGRRPLLTGGEMRAISVASRAAGKFERTQKRLQKMGMIRKPAPRARIPAALPPHQHQITSGG